MNATYILHGGFTPGKTDEDNSRYYTEILKNAPEKAKVLLVCFAKDAERVPSSISKVIAEFERTRGTREITFEVATSDAYLEQVKSADIVYFHGGKSLTLLNALKKFPDFRNLFDGKIIAGESAGANVWAHYFYSPAADQVGEGLGYLPIKLVPHYRDEYRGKLDSVGKDLEEVHLREYEFRVFR